MAKKWRRLSLSFDTEHDREITKLRKKLIPYAPESIAIREILLQLAAGSINLLQSAAMMHGYRLTPIDNASSSHSLRARASDPEKKEEKKEKKGNAKGKQLAPLDVVGRILSDLNRHTGKDLRPTTVAHRERIQFILAQDFTEQDFFDVHRNMAKQWMGTEYEKFLRPSTLYASKFDEYRNMTEPEPSPTHDPNYTAPEDCLF